MGYLAEEKEETIKQSSKLEDLNERFDSYNRDLLEIITRMRMIEKKLIGDIPEAVDGSTEVSKAKPGLIGDLEMTADIPEAVDGSTEVSKAKPGLIGDLEMTADAIRFNLNEGYEVLDNINKIV